MINIQKLTLFFEEQAEINKVSFFGYSKLQKEDWNFAQFEKWLSEQKHAAMSFLENHKHCRLEPYTICEGTSAAFCFGFNYAIDKNDLIAQNFTVAKYARYRDYHKTLKKIGENILKEYIAQIDSSAFGRVMVDSAPIFERVLANRGGRGFIGKNTLFITPSQGSFFLLFEIVLSGEFEFPSHPVVDHKSRDLRLGGCGTCKRCKVHCPTGALDQDFVLDATLCLSYWTIEHRDIIPVKFWTFLKDSIFGCDICQNVCPYNRKSISIKSEEIYLKKLPDLFDIVTMDHAFYIQNFAGTPLTRAKKEGLQRNALISMIVSRHPLMERAIEYAKDSEVDLLRKTTNQLDEFSRHYGIES